MGIKGADVSTHMVTVEKRAIVTRMATEDELWFGEPETVEVAAAGWYAVCSCGWDGNNPHESEVDAELACGYHEEHGPIEDARAVALARFREASTDADRASAIDAYNEPGALTDG